MSKIKQRKPVKYCTNCFSPQYLKFNLSYFKPEKNFFDRFGGQMLKRMYEVSSEKYVLLLNKNKSVGLEFERLDIGKEIPGEFKKRFQAKEYEKLAVIRLFTNNNPVMARIVGVVINQIFYVFYVFEGETGYKR